MDESQPTGNGENRQNAASDQRPMTSRTTWWRDARRRRPVVVVAAIAVVVLAVSGAAVGYSFSSANADGSVTAAGTPTSTDSQAATAAPQVTSTPTSTPIPIRTAVPSPGTSPATPTPSPASSVVPFEVPAKPESVLPLDCSGLVPESVRVEALGDAGHLLNTGGPANDDMIAAEWQAGVLRCVWFSATETSSLQLEVLPNGLADFRKFSSVTYGTYGSQLLGPDSRVTCDAASPTSVWSCRGGFVPAGSWVEFNFGGARTGVPPAENVLSDLATAVTATLTAAGPARTIPPLGADVPRGWTSCDQWDSAGLRSAMNAPALGAPSTYDYALDMTTTANHRTGLVDCSWSAPTGLTHVSVSILPGGGWAVPDVAAATAEYPTGTHSLIAVPGAQGAELTCFLAYGNCIIRASVSGSLVTMSTLSLPGSGRDAVADAKAAAAYLVANLPR